MTEYTGKGWWTMSGNQKFTLLMTALVLAFFSMAVVLGSSGPSHSDRQDQRFRECVKAGGSYWTDDSDWGCDTGEGKG